MRNKKASRVERPGKLARAGPRGLPALVKELLSVHSAGSLATR
jgi:hypothetical protein